MSKTLHFSYGWFYFCVYRFKIVPMYDKTWESVRIHYFKVGVTPKERDVLKRGL